MQQPSSCHPGRWEAVSGPVANQILVTSNGREIGQVNSRAAAILGPLLQGRLIDLEFQQNQQAGGASGRALYIFAKVGVEGNAQVRAAAWLPPQDSRFATSALCELVPADCS